MAKSLPQFETDSQVQRIIREAAKEISPRPVEYSEAEKHRGGGKLKLRVCGDTAEWFFRFTFWDEQGERQRYRMKIGNATGTTDKYTYAEARAEKDRLRSQLKEGINPKEDRDAKAEAEKAQAANDAGRGTVEQLFQYYVEDMKRRGKKTWAQVETSLLTGEYAAVKTLGKDTKAASVAKDDIIALLKKIYARGSDSMAERMRVYLHGAYQCAIKNENRAKGGSSAYNFQLSENPVAVIPADEETRKVGERVLASDEIKSVWFDMLNYGVTAQVHNSIKLCLAVGGQRVKEVVEARIDEFDLENRLWKLPAARTKNGRDHHVPLSDMAVAIIGECLKENESAFLFPNAVDASRPMSFTAPGHAITRYIKEVKGEEWTKADHWTPRDIRRTVRTLLADAGEPGYRLDIWLNHGRTLGIGEKHYEKAQRLEDKTLTLAKWDTILCKVLGIKQGKIISLPKANV